MTLSLRLSLFLCVRVCVCVCVCFLCRYRKLRPATDELPTMASYELSRWERGTLPFEAIAGAHAAVDYLASLGDDGGNGEAGRQRQPCCRKADTHLPGFRAHPLTHYFLPSFLPSLLPSFSHAQL